MRELQKIISKYFQKDGTGIVYYNISQELFNKVIDPNNIMSYERPDILSVFDNNIVGIEHFEFDSYKSRNKRGSDFKIKDYIIEKKFDEKMKKQLKENDSVIFHAQIESTASLQNYFNNFKKVFISHYKKLNDYLNHIKTDFDCSNKDIHFCFFVEDESPLGSYYLNSKREICLLTPLFSDEIIELLKNSPKVEYLVIGTYAMSEHKMIIIENKEETLERFKNEHEKIKEDDFLAFSPQTTGYALKIPKEYKNKL